MLYNMTWLEKILFLKRIKGSGNPMHEATSTSGSFVTDVVAPLKKLLLTLSPIQSGSGTPSPDNVRPISGHTEVDTYVCGKNLWDTSDLRSGKAIFGNEAVGASAVLYDSSATNTYVKLAYVKSGQTYTLSWAMSTAAIATANRVGYICDDNGVVLQRGLITWINGSTHTSITANVDGWLWASVDKNATDFQLELGTTATSYEPYQGTSYTTPLGRTVYGADVEQVSGMMTDKYGMVDLSTLSWSSSSGIKLSTDIANVVKAPSANNIPANIVAEKYATSAVAPISANDGKIGIETTGRIQCGSSETPSGILVYELATPQTYQLDPQQINSLNGQNNIIAEDGAEVSEVVYMTHLVGGSLLGGSMSTPDSGDESEESNEES